MKTLKISFLLFMSLITLNLVAQDKTDRPSPPKSESETVNGTELTIDYSSPAVKDRTVWGDLVPYGKTWRTGANEATTLTVSKDVKIDGKSVKAGKYGLFTIPGEKEWTFIINSVWDQWGDYNYDASKDVTRFTAKPYRLDEKEERLKFEISADGKVELEWDQVGVSFMIETMK